MFTTASPNISPMDPTAFVVTILAVLVVGCVFLWPGRKKGRRYY